MDPQEFDFLIARYNGLSKEIEFSKNRQWAVTGATIALYGIIIKFGFTKIIAIVLSFFIYLASLAYLKSSQNSLKINNSRMKKVFKRFPNEQEMEREIFEEEEKEKKALQYGNARWKLFLKRLNENLSFLVPWLYIAIVTLGFFLVVAAAFKWFYVTTGTN
ncbi:MAG: hypothetical protein ACFFDT_09140 [Candidatus Hodarchaeota archaeon]